MGRRLLLLGVLLALVSCGKRRVDPFVHWYLLPDGEAIARSEHRAMLVFFHADWSGADRMLEHETFPHADVRHELRDVVAVSVDATDDEDPTLRPIQKRFRVVGVPTIILLDPDGKELVRLNDYVKPEELARLIHERRR